MFNDRLWMAIIELREAVAGLVRIGEAHNKAFNKQNESITSLTNTIKAQQEQIKTMQRTIDRLVEHNNT